ncbi:MAG: hypothetical protein ABF484_07235 [Bifidobacterium sp.]|uniref:hypothetical protein n=2 Tax=Bifidobacterium sp. TaxID=41200 RepID=UPI0039E73828
MGMLPLGPQALGGQMDYHSGLRVHREHARAFGGFMMRSVRDSLTTLSALVIALVIALGLTACAPSAGAVGDAPASSSLAHDGIDRSDVSIVFVGSAYAATTSADKEILQYLKARSLQVRYSSSVNVKGAQAAAIRSAITLRSTLIMLRCNVSGDGQRCNYASDVVKALTSARNAGIPVVLITDEQRVTELDSHLYAAQFVLGSTSQGSPASTDQKSSARRVTLETAAFTVMNDLEHAKIMYASH